MIGNDILKQFNKELKPCKKCGGEALLVLSRPTLYNCNYIVNIVCHRCKKHIRGKVNLTSSDDFAPIRKAIRVWNELNNTSSKIFPIDEKLMGFDDDQKSFACTMLHIAGYPLAPEVLSKYVQHSTINFKETFDSLTKEQKAKVFFMVGEALGYSWEEGDANGSQ